MLIDKKSPAIQKVFSDYENHKNAHVLKEELNKLASIEESTAAKSSTAKSHTPPKASSSGHRLEALLSPSDQKTIVNILAR
jgi:hypothetical protein